MKLPPTTLICFVRMLCPSLAQLICSPSKHAYSYLSMKHTRRWPESPVCACASAPCQCVLDRHLPPKALVQCTAPRPYQQAHLPFFIGASSSPSPCQHTAAAGSRVSVAAGRNTGRFSRGRIASNGPGPEKTYASPQPPALFLFILFLFCLQFDQARP